MPASSPSVQQLPFRHAFLRGTRLGLPILLGYFPIGAAFGMLARTIGLTALQAVVCSATAFAGAGQFIALSVLASGASAVAVVAATTVVNLRHVLFGATLSPHLRDTPARWQALLAFTLTDETFAVNITDVRQGLADRVSMAGVGVISWSGWVLGTAAGALAAKLIGDPSRWGADFAMPAMFTALLVAQAEDRRHVVVGVLAALLAIGAAVLLPGKWYVLAAAVTAATVGATAYR